MILCPCGVLKSAMDDPTIPDPRPLRFSSMTPFFLSVRSNTFSLIRLGHRNVWVAGDFRFSVCIFMGFTLSRMMICPCYTRDAVYQRQLHSWVLAFWWIEISAFGFFFFFFF
ncbi:hypothetical protein VTH06DRAFT_744 [Thermothelomyces fergusii]